MKNEPDYQLKDSIIRWVRTAGLDAVEVPKAAQRTPDLLIKDSSECSILVEVKTRRDDQEYLQQIDDDLNQGGVVARSRSINYSNSIDKILSDGADQLRKSDPQSHSLHLIWLHCDGFDADLYQTQAEATVYGIAKLVSDHVPSIISCYYFGESSFFRLRSLLDGIVLSKGSEGQLLLNDHAPHLEKLKSSGLASIFGTATICKTEESAPHIMVNDSPLPRSDDKANLAYLRGKYGLKHLQTFPMGHYRAMMRRPE